MTFKNKIDELFMEMVKASLEEKKSVKDEDASNDKSDDGEGMDKVDPKAVKKKFKDRKDKDIDNDGDVDSSDEYLHKRRKAISKAVDESKVEEGKRGFIMAAKAAKEKGEKTFMFAGKEYNCEDIDEDGNMKEFHAPGMAPKGRAKAKPASTKKSLSDIRSRADSFKKKVKESVELEEESKTIAKVKEIVAKKQAMKIDGVMVDMFTASAISQIYDKVNDANKKKMDGLKITKLADVAMKLMKREEVEEELEENAKGALRARLAKVSNYSKKGKEKVTLKKAPWEKKKESIDLDPELKEASCGCGPDCEHCKGNHAASEIGEKCSCCGNEIKESSDVQEKKNYEIKGNKIHISKKDFRKVHKDFKNTTKGKERMMALDPKTGGTASFPVVFTESNFKEKFKRSLTKRLSESAKTEEKSDEVANRYNELKTMSPVELTKLYMKHHEDADMDSAKKMEKSAMISAIIEKEMGRKDTESESED